MAVSSMNKLQTKDVELFYQALRIIMNYGSHKFHLHEDIDFINSDSLNPNLCSEVSNKIWENPSLIDELLSKTEVSDEIHDLIFSWKNCVKDTFFIERYLKSGTIFISSEDKVYRVLGLNDSYEDMLWQFNTPVVLRATLLPFRNVIISDGLLNILPVTFGSGYKSELKEVYMQAKQNDQIITHLP